MRLHVGWAINRIPHYSSGKMASKSAVGLNNRRRLILDIDSSMYVHAMRK